MATDTATQPYADVGTLQAADNGIHGMDPAAIAAAAQQLEAIHAALQQAGHAALQQAGHADPMNAFEHLSQTKAEDCLAHLAVVNAAVAAAAENMAAHHSDTHDGEGHDNAGAGGDKPLTSRYRGVCWNKKNRRWQAAINSSGKYIYLGSFLKEEEAARAFDKAAIRLRGHRAKVNYSLSDYVDKGGNLVDDPRLSAHLQNVLGKEGGKGGKSSGCGDQQDGHTALLTGSAQPNSLYGQNFAQVHAAMHILGQGKSPHYPYSGAQKQAYGVVDVPAGSTPTAHIPGDEDAFAVLFTGPTVRPGGLGAIVWDGSGAIDLGVFDTDNDARNAASSLLKVAMFYKHTLQSALSPQSDSAVVNCQQASSSMAQYGLLLAGSQSEQAAGDTDAAAVAAAAAAVAATSDTALVANLGMQSNLDPSQLNQYKDLFAFLNSAGLKKSADALEDAAVDVMGLEQPTEADMAGAEAIRSMMMATGGLKNLREQGDGIGDDEGGGKRMRADDGTAQIKQLSAFKLQDVMKTLFDQQHVGQ